MWSPSVNRASGEHQLIDELRDVKEDGIEEESQSSAAPPKRVRLGAIDLLRGLIMIIMCWDHSKDAIASREGDCSNCGQHWQGSFSTFDGKWYWFLARFISHFCAPGFFLLMGVGMALFAVSRCEVPLGLSFSA